MVQYEVIGSVAEKNIENSHKTCKELKRRFACIRGGDCFKII